MHTNLNHPCQKNNHISTRFYQIVPRKTPPPSYIDPWEVQKQEHLWRPSGTIIYPHGCSWLRLTSANSCPIQYPQHWVINIEPGKIPNLLLHNKKPMTKKYNWKKLISTQQSTRQKCHQAKYTLIKMANFPPNQKVGTNTWWSFTHMNQTTFL